MTYATAQALRMALEQRLLTRSRESGVDLERLRRRVVFERILARLHAAQPGRWVVKGGMALEVRLHDDARLTKDLDLGLRDDVGATSELRDRIVEALAHDIEGDRFAFAVGPVTRLMEDGAGRLTWRTKVTARLAGRPFGGIQLDVSPRAHELDETDVVSLPSALAFAGVAATEVEIVGVDRHAAEKLHGLLRDFGERENTRVRDLVDLVILCEHDLLDASKLAIAVRRVWAERGTKRPPAAFPELPASWPDRYERLVAQQDLQAKAFPAAVAVVTELWSELFRADED